MEKTIIAVRGQPNSGKTTAITDAHKKLSKEGTSVYSNPRWDATELKEVLEVDGIHVGFASAGDKPDRLESILRFLLAHGCVVIVCAARLNRAGQPFHKTIDAVKQFADDHKFRLQWIKKPRQEHDQENANGEIANEIVARIRRAIGNAQLVDA